MASDWGNSDKKVGRVWTQRGAPGVLGEVEGDPRAGERWGGERAPSLFIHFWLLLEVLKATTEGDVFSCDPNSLLPEVSCVKCP